MEEKDYTFNHLLKSSLLFCRRKGASESSPNEILLGLKKRGFGVGKWNGFGGKIEAGETIEAAAVRELEEECGLRASNITRMGYLNFMMVESSLLMRVHVFECWEWEGDAVETEEMKPTWFEEANIPLASMWPDDSHWLPLLLAGKRFLGRFTYEDQDTISDFTVSEN